MLKKKIALSLNKFNMDYMYLEPILVTSLYILNIYSR